METTINGYDPGTIASFVSRLENLHADLASERGEYMERCKEIRSSINDVLQEASDNEAIPRKALKTIVKDRELRAKLETMKAELEEADAVAFRHLEAALGSFGDTPLGEAAKSAAKGAKRGGKKEPMFDEDAVSPFA